MPERGRFVLATANPHKLLEIRAILSGFPIVLQSLHEFPAVRFEEETGKTYEENALNKAVQVSRELGLASLADDSGLEIEALDNQPGLYSSRFLGGDTGYEVKNRRILDLLKSARAEKRTARFVCAAAAAFPDGTSRVVRGVVRGTIALELKGSSGFGYDPIFFLPEYGKTMAELSPEEKNKISHRAVAFRKLLEGRGDPKSLI